MSVRSLVEETFAELVQSLDIPGLAVSVVLDGEIVAAAGFGVRSVETRDPVAADTVFRIGSTTKPMTGTLVMQLVDEGLLDLDAPIRTYLPRFTLSRRGAAEGVTLRRLLTHQSGLQTAAVEHGARDASGLAQHVREVIPKAPLHAAPGTFYSYSNLGLDLAGYICEVVAGAPFDTLLGERVIGPAGMTRTTLDPLVAMTYPLAQSHESDAEGRLRVLHRFAENVGHHPSGFVMSTVEDLARFARVHLGDGAIDGRRIISVESAREMRRSQVSLRLIDGTASGITFGIRQYKGVTTVSHDGGISGFGSQFILIPERRAAICLLYNRLTLPIHMQLQAAAMSILDRLLGLEGEPFRLAPVPPQSERMPALTGTYLSAARGLVRVRADAEGLSAVVNGRYVTLTQVGNDLFAGGEQSFAFVKVEGEERPRYLLVDAAPCERVALLDEPALSADLLARYVGAYSGFDMLVITLEDDALWARLPRFTGDIALRCVPIDETRFACDVGILRFDARADGRYDVTLGEHIFHPVDGP